MLLPDENIDQCLTHLVASIQRNYKKREMLIAVSHYFKHFIYSFDTSIEEYMEVPFTLQVQIAYFIDDRSGDQVEYLVGPIRVLTRLDTTNYSLPSSHVGKDHYGMLRHYEPVIMHNVFLGKTLASCIILPDMPFDDQVRHISADPTQCVTTPPLPLQIEALYWLYVIQVTGNYFKTFSYIILPYCCHESVRGNVIAIYELIPGIELQLEDLDMPIHLS